MRRKAARTAYLAVFTAFSAAFVYLASVTPTGQLGFLAAASLPVVAAVAEFGAGGGTMAYAASSVLGLLLAPDKALTLLYVLFFGWYPILKSAAEKRRSRLAEWAIKLAAFNAALTLILFAFRLTVFDLSRVGGSYAAAYAVLNAVFAVFDYGVSKLIVFYMARIHSHIRRG